MFRLNRLTDYAVVVMSQMAVRNGAVCKAPDIARDTAVPLPTVAKILNALMKAELVTSQRGMAGGYSLTKAPTEISVADIVEALEGPIALTACVTGATEACDVESLCPMRGRWNKVNGAIRRALEGVSLAEISVNEVLLAMSREQVPGRIQADGR